MLTLTEKLAKIQRYATRYEVVAVNGDRQILIGYTPRKSFRGMFDMACKNGPDVAKALGLDCSQSNKRSGLTLDFRNGWVLKFSGRTQREAYIAGELPFVCDVAASMESPASKAGA